MATLNAHAAQVLALMAESGQPALDELPPEQARSAIAQGLAALQAPPAEVGEIRSLTADCGEARIPLRLYRPPTADDTVTAAILFFHGGGFVLGDLDLYDGICRRLCAAAAATVLSVDYRLAPEHPFPAAVEDAVAVARWVSSEAEQLGICRDRLCLAGDSAGANLAAVTAIALRDAEGIPVAHQLLLYPVTDLSRESEGYRRCGEGYFLTTDLMHYFRDHYLGRQGPAHDWRASPLLAERLAGLPAATVLVCGFDPLRDEGIAYARALEAAGVAVDLIEVEDQIHGYLLMDGAIPEAVATLESLGQGLRRQLDAAMPAAS